MQHRDSAPAPRRHAPAVATGSILLFAFGAALPAPISASSEPIQYEHANLHAPDGAMDDRFGRGVGLSSDVAVVTAPFRDGLRGAAFVFRRQGDLWTDEAELIPTDELEERDQFGAAAAVWGDVAVIGSNKSLVGAAFVFRKHEGSWVEEAKLLPGDGLRTNGGSTKGFGRAVALQGDVALVAAASDDERKGAVYVYRYDGGGWVEEAKLLASDGLDENATTTFGASVALSGDTAIVGATDQLLGGGGFGAAYIFRHDGEAWVEEDRISNPREDDQYGGSVAISGDVALVGASGDAPGNVFDLRGRAYLYRNDGKGSWGLEKTLQLLAGGSTDRFGSFVALSGDTALVSAGGTNSTQAGRILNYCYQEGDWTEVAQLVPHDHTSSDSFGGKIAISGERAIVGWDNDDDLGANSGSAYIFGTEPFEAPSLLPRVTKLHSPEPGTRRNFGRFVAVSGDYALGADLGGARAFRFDGEWRDDGFLASKVGFLAPSTLALSGPHALLVSPMGGLTVVQLFRRGETWDPIAVLSGEEPSAIFSVALSHLTAFLGSPFTGDVRVHREIGGEWLPQSPITPSDADGRARTFGSCVAVSGERVLVGASSDSDVVHLGGAGYVFRWNGEAFVEEAKLLPGDYGGQLGASCALSGDIALLGAPTADPGGAAYVFRRDGTSWVEEAKLFDYDRAVISDDFGASVALHGSLAVIGRPSDTDKGEDAGAVYVFLRRHGAWERVGKLVASDGLAGDTFGSAIALSADWLAVGAPGDDDVGADAGTMHFFVPEPAAVALGASAILAVAFLARRVRARPTPTR